MSETAEQGVERLQRQQAALSAFGSYAFREPSLLNILTEAARVCAQCLQVPFSKVCRFRDSEQDLLIVAGYGWREGVVGQVVSPANETSPQGRAYVTGKPVVIINLRDKHNDKVPAFYAEYGITSTMDVIIKGFEGEPYGVLEIDSVDEHVYDEDDINFLTGFANVLAEAVATANRVDVLQHSLEDMRAMVTEKNQLLEQKALLAEELKHRVRNNLQLIYGMLVRHLTMKSGAEEKASTYGIMRRVMTLAEVYEQLLGTGLGRTVDLGAYLKAICASLPGLQEQPRPEITLTCVAESVPVGLDTTTAIGMVVAELIANSYEHAFPSANGTITVSLHRPKAVSKEAILIVEDNGTGFTERPGSKRHGVGLVRRLMQQVQGSADMHSGSGTVWTLQFPIIETEP